MKAYVFNCDLALLLGQAFSGCGNIHKFVTAKMRQSRYRTTKMLVNYYRNLDYVME